MADRLRFHLDEHMDPEIAAALRRHGIDLTTTVESGLRTLDDPAHIRFANSEGRVVVTDDADFLRLASTTTGHPGILFCRRRTHSLGEIIRFALLAWEVYTAEEMVGRVEYL